MTGAPVGPDRGLGAPSGLVVVESEVSECSSVDGVPAERVEWQGFRGLVVPGRWRSFEVYRGMCRVLYLGSVCGWRGAWHLDLSAVRDELRQHLAGHWVPP